MFIRKYIKTFSVTTLIVFSVNLFAPTVTYAIDGPKQPEVKTFTPVTTSDMVDLFTGNFNYNIPLLDVGGYPVNISYTANPTMEQEASWVGLGWNINVGNIDRNMRGLPDDFSGDQITKIRKKKINRTMGVTVQAADIEVFGLETSKFGLKAGGSLGAFRNNYTGSGSVVGLDLGLDLKLAQSGKDSKTLGLGVGATVHSDEGLTVSPSLSFASESEKSDKHTQKGSFALGSSFNTEEGWKGLSFNYGVSSQELKNSGELRSRSKNGNSYISFAYPAIPPSISMPTFSSGMSFNATIGAEAFGVHGNIKVRAHYSQQSLKDDWGVPLPSAGNLLVPGFMPGSNPLIDLGINFSNMAKADAEVSLPAYGYLYAHNASGEKVLYDFNREKEGPFTANRPNLPIPNFTHDVFTVNGQGISGMYRPFRNDVGVLHDPEAVSTSANIDFPGLEIGAGNAVHVGANFAVALSNNTTGKWNELDSELGFKGFSDTDPDFEPYYFKQAGEKTADFSDDFFTKIGGFDPVRVKLEGDILSIIQLAADPTGITSPNIINATNEFQKQNLRNPVSEISFDDLQKPDRQARNQNVQFLNALEAGKFGVEKKLPDFGTNNFKMDEKGAYSSYYGFTRNLSSLGRAAHHISEISATRPDGSRYIYGIPVYNRYQKEVSFAIECDKDNLVPDCETGLIYYENEDASLKNNKGIDNSFDSEETPAYPHSFLLTSILSDDYVDVTEDGPSDDDLGSYTKFNYSKVHSNQRWRIPYEENQANYFAGFNADLNDGKASYVYGTRELWYLHSIVTKTHVAEFILEDREDAVGVDGEHGGIGTQKMKKLVRIDLYAKPDKLKEAKSNGRYSAVPLKSVHFQYNYSLCTGVPSNPGISDGNQGGKLTLKKIFFTYQNSNKARLSPYEFEYAYNPAYSEKAQDRWGTYKPHYPSNGEHCFERKTNIDFPYTEQNKSEADIFAGAWNLTTISLPSGATIDIDYESDDYAFVQDRPAMEMFTIAGSANSPGEFNPNSPLTTSVGDYLFFRLSESYSNETDAVAAIRDQYLRQMAFQQEKVYFKCFADMPNGLYDYVPGYADITEYGAVAPAGGYDYGYIRLKRTEDDRNPVTKSAMNLVKMNLPLLLKDNEDISCQENFGDNLLDLVEKTLLVFSGIDGIGSTYDKLAGKRIGKQIQLNKSIIRLYNPSQRKLGGGSRVKRITIKDDWNLMSGSGASSVYGQEYSYTTSDGTGGIISSGVAAYEPFVGGEENPFRQPVFFDEERLGVPDEEYFLEEPMGESFFPGASVGYSKVTVRDISVSGNDITYNPTGKVVHEFYTAKDFPTRTDDTDLAVGRQKPSVIAQILKINIEDHVTTSQGYVIELNDMHGKTKSVNIFQHSTDISGQETAPLSSVVYKYKMDPASGNLDNNVLVMNRSDVSGKNEFVESRMVGVDYDFIADMRKHESSTTVVSVNGNVETFLAAIFPIIIPIVLPNLSAEKVTFRSAVTTKVINRYGLLDETITQDLGKQDTLRNLLYDGETGEVLLTESKNEYDDPVYSFTYPAHFAYDRMGAAYKNAGTIVRTASLENISGASDRFVMGDELIAFNIDSADANLPAYFKGWVKSVGPGNSIEIIDSEGFPLQETAGTGDYILKVIRSGRRNLQASSIGSIISLESPLQGPDSNGAYLFEFDKVVDAQMIEYDDRWKIFCNCSEEDPAPVVIVK